QTAVELDVAGGEFALHALHVLVALERGEDRVAFRAGGAETAHVALAHQPRHIAQALGRAFEIARRGRGLAFVDAPVQRDQQARAGAEMLVGDRLADAGAFGQIAQGQRVGALLAHDRQRRFQQLFAPFGFGQAFGGDVHAAALGRGRGAVGAGKKVRIALDSVATIVSYYW
ncbi:hypothetical protein CATMIT_01718, partial [Catenibacterium mitsuokai DSM 15897]